MDRPTVLRSRADVVTDVPARYAKQLVSHLGRKVPFEDDGTTATATLGGATGRVVVGDGVLVLTAEGDEQGLALVEDVLGRHLERFGQRDGLVVTWVREAAA